MATFERRAAHADLINEVPAVKIATVANLENRADLAALFLAIDILAKHNDILTKLIIRVPAFGLLRFNHKLTKSCADDGAEDAAGEIVNEISNYKLLIEFNKNMESCVARSAAEGFSDVETIDCAAMIGHLITVTVRLNARITLCLEA